MSQITQLNQAVSDLNAAVQNVITQSASTTPDADVTAAVTAIQSAVAQLNTAFPKPA